MAFNPLKKIINQQPTEQIQQELPANLKNDNQHSEHIAPTEVDDNIVNYETNPVIENSNTLFYEGAKISDLQETGLKTEKILNADVAIVEKTHFNLPLLKSLPLSFVLTHFGATQSKNNLYSIYNNDISIKENRWYNVNLKKGFIDAMSLTKHLIALRDKVDENLKDKMLFVAARSLLNDIQSLLPDNIEEKPSVNNVITPTSNEETASTESKQARVNRTPEEHKAFWKALTEQLDNISLDLVMEHIGATPNEDGQAGKWKVLDTRENINITGQMWKPWKAKGGHGAINLLAYHIATKANIDTRIEEQKKQVRMMAIKELLTVFGDGDLSMLSGDDAEIVFKVPFAMPLVIDFKINHVRHYLNEKRGIPLWVVNKQINTGLLFAGYPSDWRIKKEMVRALKDPERLKDEDVWAVFLSINGTAAEMRGIARNDDFAKILAKGSDKDFGGFLIKAEKSVNEKVVTAVEASVDALSYHAIFPGRIVTSCMGVTFSLAAKAAFEALGRNYTFHLGFDNDQTGNETALNFRDELISLFDGDMDLYNEHYAAGRIKYFDLGLRCLEECIEKNQIFYLDVQDNPVGIDVVKLFQAQAQEKFGRDEFRNIVSNGFVKYLNVCPIFNRMIDIEKEIVVAFNKLDSGKPYYLRIKNDDNDSLEEQQRSEEFERGFRKLAGEKYKQWEDSGLIIYDKNAIAKDWNEYFIYLKENKPEFKIQLQEREQLYLDYSNVNTTTKKKSKKI